MIAGVCCVQDDADIIGVSLEHHLNEGVDRIYVAHGPSSDLTGEILRHFAPEVVVTTYNEPEFNQQPRTDRLAAQAASDGASWIVPFDADEFWSSRDGVPLATALKRIDLRVGTVVAEWRHHQDWEHTFVEDSERLPKVAYRWSPTARVGPGNHTVAAGGLPLPGCFVVHHLRYRSLGQFCRKVRLRCERQPDWERARGHGWHILQYDGMSDEQLADAWQAWLEQPVYQDPIPLRSRTPNPRLVRTHN